MKFRIGSLLHSPFLGPNNNKKIIIIVIIIIIIIIIT